MTNYRRFKITLFFAPLGLFLLFLLGPLLRDVLYFGIFLLSVTYYGIAHHGHQEFGQQGVSQIPPAAQMSELFEDCRSYITYGPGGVSTWNSDAYFDGRYELTMQVPVRITSSQRGRMIGEPQFYLLEVDKVEISASGQVGASFSNQKVFGLDEWEKVYAANGDFAVIGFPLKRNQSVKDFNVYAKATRH